MDGVRGLGRENGSRASTKKKALAPVLPVRAGRASPRPPPPARSARSSVRHAVDATKVRAGGARVGRCACVFGSPPFFFFAIRLRRRNQKGNAPTGASSASRPRSAAAHRRTGHACRGGRDGGRRTRRERAFSFAAVRPDPPRMRRRAPARDTQPAARAATPPQNTPSLAPPPLSPGPGRQTAAAAATSRAGR